MSGHLDAPAAGPGPGTAPAVPAITRPCPVAPAPVPGRRDSIFLSVAAYCVPLLAFTLRSAFSQASDPSRVFAGVVEQALPGQQLQLPDAFAAQQLRWVRLHALEARGPCWARALSETEFIAVERAFAFGVGNTIRLVHTRVTPQTTDVSGFDSLAANDHVPMTRELLLEMPITWNGITMDNIEAISWGHTLANGHRSLVLAADNNFSGTQLTQFIALEVSAVPEPGTWALMLGGLVAVVARRAPARAGKGLARARARRPGGRAGPGQRAGRSMRVAPGGMSATSCVTSTQGMR